MTAVANGHAHTRVEAAPEPRVHLPHEASFDANEAEQWRARAERASYDHLNSAETSRLLKNVSRMLYCALVDAAQGARVRLASVIALDGISQRLRRCNKDTDLEDMLVETVASVTLVANANAADSEHATEHPIEDMKIVPRAPLSTGSESLRIRAELMERHTVVDVQ